MSLLGSVSVYIWGETVGCVLRAFSDPGKTEASLAIARDTDEMVFFTPS